MPDSRFTGRTLRHGPYGMCWWCPEGWGKSSVRYGMLAPDFEILVPPGVVYSSDSDDRKGWMDPSGLILDQ